MKKNNIYIYITASLALIVPSPGRFAYGIILVLTLNLMMMLGTAFKKGVSILNLDDLQPVLIAVLLVAVSVLCKLLLTLFSPVMALTIGYTIYMPAVSSFLIGYLYGKSSMSFTEEFSYNMKHALTFSVFSLVIFLFRDIFGYGTISLPAHFGIASLSLWGAANGIVGVFWASVPGALVLTALCMVLFAVTQNSFAKMKAWDIANASAVAAVSTPEATLEQPAEAEEANGNGE